MVSGKKLWERPVVRHRLQVGGHALVCGSIAATARRFAHDRKTVRDCLRRYQEYLKRGASRCSSTARGAIVIARRPQ